MNATAALPEGFVPRGEGAACKREICDMLADMRLFADSEWRDIETLAGFLQCYGIAAGTVVFSEGDPGSYMGLLVSGEVEILKADNEGVARRVVLVTAGKTIGEMSIIDGEPRSATCVAAADSVMLLLTRENYGRLIRERPMVAVHVLSKLARLMSQRLRGLTGQLVDYLPGRE